MRDDLTKEDYKFKYEQSQELVSIIKDMCRQGGMRYDINSDNALKNGYALAHLILLNVIHEYQVK